MTTVKKNLNHIIDATELLYRNSIGGIIICIIASTVLVFAFPDSGIFDDKVIWWVAINVLMYIRLLDTYWWHQRAKKAKTPDDPQLWLTKFRAGALLTALLWGIFGAVTMQQMGDVEFVATVIILSALAGAAPTPLSADRLLALVYSSLLIVPISVAGVLDAQYMRQILGAMGLLFAVTMIFSALKITRFTAQAIFLKHHNKDLLEQTSKDTQKLAEQHQQLEDSYQEISNIKEGLELQVQKRTEELLQLSQHDGLTGLLNRKTFIERLSQQLCHPVSHFSDCAVLFVDINKFKKINDTQGHATGDHILVKVATVLRHLPGDPVVARWGGDEFVAFLNIDSNQLALEYGELINAAIETETQNFASDISAAIGVAFSSRHSRNSDELVKLADIAMFEHKKDPTFASAVVFEPRFLSQLERAEALRSGLFRALDNDEMSLVFQPVYDLQSGSVTSYETLLRWQFFGEAIEPEEFIPIAEQSQVICELGLWVLEEGCRNMLAADLAPSVTLAVNISIQQLKRPTFAQQVLAILARTGFPANRLHLEITESVFCDKPGELMSSISKLRLRGVTFGLDDFGTGYSSMAQLQALPFSSIKIDKRFVADLGGAGGAIIQSIVMLAQELGMSVIVEGIETKRQLDQVHDMGVNLIQGFFFAKPMSVPDPLFKPAIVFEHYHELH